MGKSGRFTSVKKTSINSSTLSMRASPLVEAIVGIVMVGGGAESCVTYGVGEVVAIPFRSGTHNRPQDTLGSNRRTVQIGAKISISLQKSS
jgi:hypothetical protein